MINTVKSSLFIFLIVVLSGCGGKKFIKPPIDDVIRDMPSDRVFSVLLHDMDVKGTFVHEYQHQYTIIEEGTGRFFSTQDKQNCWSDIQRHEQVSDMDDLNYRVSGIVYCLAPLAELNGAASVTFAEMKFTGRLRWKVPK